MFFQITLQNKQSKKGIQLFLTSKIQIRLILLKEPCLFPCKIYELRAQKKCQKLISLLQQIQKMSNSENLSPALRQSIINFNQILQIKHKQLPYYIEMVNNTYKQFIHPPQKEYICDCGETLTDIKKKGAHKKYYCVNKIGQKVRQTVQKKRKRRNRKDKTRDYEEDDD